jgi:hypothetical protein
LTTDDWKRLGGIKMSDPDATGGTTGGTPPSPEQIEMRLNGRKHPVNPNDGIGGGNQIDGAVPPPKANGVDPTVAHYDPDSLVFVASGETPPRITNAPIDYMPGYGPGTGPAPSSGGSARGGGTTNTSRSWPT